jgi:hypothetical protein
MLSAGIFSTPAAAAGVGGLTFLTSGKGDSSSKLIPATSVAGDLAVLLDTAVNNSTTTPTATVPTGFTSLVTSTGTLSANPIFRAVRCTLSAKVLAGGEPGSAVSGLSGSGSSRYIILVFRSTSTISSFTANSTNGEVTGSDPTSQSVTSGSSAIRPTLVIAQWMNSDNDISPRLTTPSLGGEVANGTGHYGQYKIYNTGDTLSNHTIGMDDESRLNGLQSLYLTLTLT